MPHPEASALPALPSLSTAERRDLAEVATSLVPDVLYLYSIPERRHLYFNREVGNLLGFSSEEVRQGGADLILGRVHPADAPRVARHMEEIARAGDDRTHEVEYRIKAKDGALRWLYVREHVYRRDASGRPEVLFGVVQDVSARKRLEESFRASLADLNRAQEAADMGSWRWHLKTNQLEWSDGMFRIFGMDPAGFSGDLAEVIARAIHPEDQEKLECANRAVLEHRAPAPLEYRVLRPDGERVVYAEAGELALDDQGRPETLSGYAQDVTEQRAREEALRLSEAQFRAFFDNVGVGSAQLDADLRFLRVNDRYCAITGYSREELLRLRPLDIGHPEEREEDARRLARLFESPGAVYDREKRYVRKDGRVIWVHATANVVRDAAGRPWRTVSVIEDISERKRAEEQLRERTRDLDRAQAVAHIGSWRLHLDRGGLDWSDEAYRIFGIAPGTPMTFESFLAAVHPDDRALVTRRWEEALRGQAPYDVEHRIVAPGPHGPSTRWVRERAELEFDARGQLVAGFGTVQDVTERKALENQLFQVQKMETVGRLAGGVAHDFNNLLTVMSGNAEIALSGLSEDDPLREELSEIREAVRRAAELTRNLLAFSRRQVASPKIVNAEALVSGMEKMLRRLIGENITLQGVAGGRLRPVRVDPGQFEQVLTNLVVNARDAMPAGGHLRVSTSVVRLDEADCEPVPDLRPGEYVLLAVSDTGCGMSKEVQEHLFEPFFTTKAPGAGTGLGLSTCYGIVKQNGGHIAVDSEVGRGTTVRVYLPAVDEPPADDAARSRSSLPRGSEHLIVVEDEPGIRHLLQRILTSCGYRVTVAAHAGEALELKEVPDDAPSLLVTDVVLPGMNGQELAERMLALHPKMRVLYVSGYAENVIAHHGLLDAGLAFLQKPFSPEALARKVREVLDVGRS